MTVYVYRDNDNEIIEVFYKLEDAKAKAEKEWPDEEGGWKDYEDKTGKKCFWGEYVVIFRKEIL